MLELETAENAVNIAQLCLFKRLGQAGLMAALSRNLNGQGSGGGI